jgi:glycosyltransferase involved in cell wall biosynthesis
MEVQGRNDSQAYEVSKPQFSSRANARPVIRSAAVVSHVFTSGPAQELVEYLRNRADRVDFIGHPFPYARDIRTFHEMFLNGDRTALRKASAWRLPSVLMFVKDFVFTINWLAREKKGFQLCVGVDSLNCLAGIFLKRMGRVRYVVFYTIDYAPNRFANPILSHLYRILDRYCVNNSDLTWNLSPRMSDVRRKTHSPLRGREVTVPVGVWLSRIKPLPISEIDRRSMAFIGHLRRGHGIELIIRSMPEILAKIPTAKLVIIGTGPLEEELRQVVGELQLTSNVEFVGLVESQEIAERIISKCSTGLAPYEPSQNSFSYYTDPGKPKLYLACGLPVITTSVPWISGLISERKMGLVIRFEQEEMVQAVTRLLTDDDFYETCRQNALNYAKDLDWPGIFDYALAETIHIASAP